MTISIGLVLILAILCWTAFSSYEWNIPLKWQVFLRTWRKRLRNKSQNIYLVWELGSEIGEMENRLWLLQRALPGLQESNKHPLWIEVQIYLDLSLEQNEKYIACLQRRFSEMKTCACSLNDKHDVRNE